MEKKEDKVKKNEKDVEGKGEEEKGKRTNVSRNWRGEKKQI